MADELQGWTVIARRPADSAQEAREMATLRTRRSVIGDQPPMNAPVPARLESWGNYFSDVKAQLRSSLQDTLKHPEYMIGAGPLGAEAGGAIGAMSRKGMVDLFRQGVPINQIARQAGTRNKFVSDAVREAGLEIRQGLTSDTWRARMAQVPGFPLAVKGSIWENPEFNRLIMDMYNKGSDFADIARELSAQSGKTVTNDMVIARARRIRQENAKIDELQEQYGPRNIRGVKRGELTDSVIKQLLMSGKSQEAIARELGVTPSYVSQRAKGIRFVDKEEGRVPAARRRGRPRLPIKGDD